MKIVNIFFIIIFILIYTIPNYYLGYKGYKSFSSTLPYFNSRAYWILFWFVVFSFVISQLVGRYLPSVVNHYLELTGYYWMGAFVFLLFIAAITDIVFFIIKRISPASYRSIQGTALMTYGGIIAAAVVLFILVYGTITALHPKVTTYNIDISKKADSLKNLNAVLISDVHIGDIIDNKRIKIMVNTINTLKPDIVFFAGDTFDQNPDVFIKEKMQNIFKQIHSKFGVYACLGNHEYYRGRTDEIVTALKSGGVQVLRDSCIKIDNAFYVAGREDLESSRGANKRKDIKDIIKGIDKSLPVLLLDHQPPKSREPLSEDIDLQLSGHTHGGQIFPSNIITNIMYRLGHGLLKVGNYHLIVSSGYGTWGPPIRVGSVGEIVNIKINFKH